MRTHAIAGIDVKLAYFSAAAFIWLSPLAGILMDRHPSPLQTWPMYATAYPACTLQFSDPENRDAGFNLQTAVLLNQGLERPSYTRFILREETPARRLLDAYCTFPSTKIRKAKALLQCFDGKEWKMSDRSGDLACKD